jgi:hypothetical protein
MPFFEPSDLLKDLKLSSMFGAREVRFGDCSMVATFW